MPEGDTIWRAARTLHAALAGGVVLSFRSGLAPVVAAAERLRIAGRTLERVESRGKHLLFFFSGGPVLHTHLGMLGRWRLEAPGGPVPGRPAPDRRHQVRIEVGGRRALCLRAAVVELLDAGAARNHPVLHRLGPDLLDEGFDAARARARLRLRGELEIAVALLDQGALAGIGNVYKSEVLFLCGVPPRARVKELDDATVERLIGTARRLMRGNLGSGPRRTTSAGSAERLFVYRRTRRPCRRCGTAVRRVVQGEQARSTYFCPRCQRPGTTRRGG